MHPGPESGACDTALVERARAGSAPAFSALVQRHQQAVRAFARRIGGDLSDGDDLAQEAFVTAWGRLGAFDGRSSFRSWVCGIAYRKGLTAKRGVLRGRVRDGDYVESRVWQDGEAVTGGARTALHKAMAELPVDQRACIAMCLAGDFSHAEAAEALGLPLGTVKSHVNRGRSKLLELLGGPNVRVA